VRKIPNSPFFYKNQTDSRKKLEFFPNVHAIPECARYLLIESSLEYSNEE